MNRVIQSDLLKIAAVFLVLQTVIITLSPGVRARTWDVDYRWSQWVALALWAFFALVVGLWTWLRASRVHKDEGSGIKIPRWKRLYVMACLGAGIALAISAMPALGRDNSSYAALTQEGFVGRDYWTGAVETEPWSSLHHVELGAAACVSIVNRAIRDRPCVSGTTLGSCPL